MRVVHGRHDNGHLAGPNQRAGTHKNKAEGLTEAEKSERADLRQQYLTLFKQSFRSQVEMLQEYNKDGKEVTPEKVRQIQRNKGLRDD